MTSIPAAPLPDIDADAVKTTAASTLILSCAWALGIGGTTMMPLLVTNTMARLGFDEGQATLMTGVEMVGMLAGCILLPPMARRWPGRCTSVSLVLLALCQMLTALTMSTPLFGALRLVAGVCEAQMIVMVGICLACHRDAERLWGVVLLLSGLAVAGVFTLVSLLPDVAAGDGIWIGLALLAAVAGLAAVRIPALVPARRPPPAEPGAGRRRVGAGVWLAWGVFVGVYSVQAGVWAVSALQGERIGLSLPTVGALLAVSSLLGFFGAVVPAIPALAARRGPTVMGALLVMFASVACFFTADGAAPFFAGQLMLNMAFYAIMAVLNSFISARDRDGSLLSQSVVVTFAAVAAGTVGAGALFQEAGGVGVIVFSLLALAISVPLGLKALGGRVSASPAP
ncbi:Predicted arabinose efflux permease, MFS family [Duganella sp. CF517]|uniref:MFS transporter n=1 Tax=Duganella sp. CF517 TaxID=1881038 RepID=UPI0008B59B99|nr:MFS transporter [Duganella sp. CF517]SEN23636.1 Predicted arabinose efflux permease, MFS family [Duganella sp. CF517]